MSRLSKLVREYVKCPQLDGGTEYGEWGALRLDQRKQITKLCEELDVFEDAADKFGKENYILKQQLAEKDKEIADLHTTINQDAVEIMMLKDYIEKRKSFIDERIVEKDKEIEKLKEEICKYEITLMDKNSQFKDQRHEICEKINDYIDKLIVDRFGDESVRYLTIDVEDFTDVLEEFEKGE